MEATHRKMRARAVSTRSERGERKFKVEDQPITVRRVRRGVAKVFLIEHSLAGICLDNIECGFIQLMILREKYLLYKYPNTQIGGVL